MNNEQIRTLFNTLQANFPAMQTPGLAVGIVDQNGLVAFKGLGFADRENQIPYTEKTLHFSGSTTKAITIMVLMLLKEQGYLDFDTPIKTYDPSFRMSDPYVENNVTIRDFMVHVSGLSELDLVWLSKQPITTSEVYETLAQAPMIHPFRVTFDYNNVTYGYLGILASRITSKPYKDLVHDLIFKPLNMSQAYIDFDDIMQGTPLAKGYQWRHNHSERVHYDNIGALAAAGQMAVSAESMAQWISAQINAGRPLINEADYSYLTTPQIPAIHDDQTQASSYGGGWFIDSYRGEEIITHSGGIEGFETYIGYSKTKKIGYIVFSNGRYSGANSIANRMVRDAVFSLPRIDWLALTHQQMEELERSAAATRTTLESQLNETRNLEILAGIYSNPAYGTLELIKKDQYLIMNFNRNIQAIPLIDLGNHRLRTESEYIMDFPLTFYLTLQADADLRLTALMEGQCFSVYFQPTRMK